MNKLVVLKLGNGDLHNGFPTVTAQLWDANKTLLTQIIGSLPAAPEVFEIYKHWQLLYLAIHQRLDLSPRIEIEPGDVTNVSEVEFDTLCQKLEDRINFWLESEPFRKIDQGLRIQLSPTDDIQFIIESNNDLIQRLPWHLWNFFEHYPQAEVALSTLEHRRTQKFPVTLFSTKVRILAIFGHSQGININRDRAFLENLPAQVEIKFLIEPHPGQLNDQLWEQRWDILFFAGHSSSQGTGQIYLNKTTNLTLDKFKFALSRAIERGLQLAIFNSCDGLGLAQNLASLQIPQVIAMREPVPDVVAQEFLKYFLAAFARGQSLYVAVREARERLQKLENQYPCATWLPVICQNPGAAPVSWQQLCGSKLSHRCRFSTVLVVSVVVTALVMGVRHLGVLQLWELQAFDQIMRLRPTESPDPRLLVVTVTEEDVRKQNLKEKRSLSDSALAKLLLKLLPHQPQVIGLDIYRDFRVDPNQPDLAAYLQDKRFIAVCDVGGENDYQGIGPPPEISSDRLSFSDFPVDADRVIRRQLLGMAPDPKSQCVTDTSFSFRVAQNYLAAQGLQVQETSQGNLQIGSVVFPKLQPDAGSYHQLDALGYQVLLNYRTANSIAKQVSLYDILSGSLDPELPNLVKDRIVLIGNTARSFKDYFPTPYSASPSYQELPGVLIHAHMVSQILSAVLDQRPLLWWLPQWGEVLWVWGWSVVGGVVVWSCRSLLYLGLASGAALSILYGLCFVFLLTGGWMPLVPATLALIVTSSSVVVYARAQSGQLQSKI